MTTVNFLKTKVMNTFKLLTVLTALTLSAATTGCGGGGGGGGSAPPPAGPLTGNPVNRTGEASFKVVFPAKNVTRSASGFMRQANALPPEAEKVTVEIYAIKLGQREDEPEETRTLDRPSNEGGEVSVKFILFEGRYVVVIKSMDAGGNVLGASTEPVRVTAGVTTSVPTTLGLLYTDEGFVPSSITLKTGDRLVVHHDGTATGDFRLSGISDCKAELARTGALACTVRQQGAYSLRGPDTAHLAEIKVQQDDTLLATAKPSLGVRRSEAIADTGSATIRFYFNNGGQTMPTGAKFNPGNGSAPVGLSTQTSHTVTYTPGSYVAELLDAEDKPIAQKYVVIYAPLAAAPTAQVVFSGLPQQVSTSTLMIAGTTSPTVTGSVVAIQVGENLVYSQTNNQGAFTASVKLKLGTNTITGYLLNNDGVEGPRTQATVSYIVSGEPGQLAIIEIEGLEEDILTAGEQVTLIIRGLDSLGSPVEFTPVITAEGFDIQVNGPTSFTPITAGAGAIIVSGPGGTSASLEVEVEGGTLAKVLVSPGNLTTRSGERIQFTVFGLDSLGNVVSRVDGATFTGTGSLSGVDATGTVTLSQTGTGVVKVTAPGGFSAEACVSVNELSQSTVLRTAAR